MANREFINIDNSSICMETPFTQDRIFTAADSTDVAAGTILKLVGEKYELAESADTFDAVLQYDLAVSTAGDLPIRPVLAGKVRADKIFLAAAPTTALTVSQKAKLKTNGILAVDVEELSKFNNPGSI